MHEPSITIFIPTYRRPFLLKKAIESALNQTWKNLTVLVCDNASGDETADIVEDLQQNDGRIHYRCHPQNIGMLRNYEFGISQITTDFFSILSDDDCLLPHFCETALKGFKDNPAIGFFACSCLMMTKDNGVFRAPLDRWPREGLYTSGEALTEMIGKYPVPTTVMFRTAAVSNVKIDFDNSVAWDCDYLIQVAGQHPIAISKEPCGFFVFHAASFSGTLTFAASLKSILRIMDRIKVYPYISKKNQFLMMRLLRKDYYKTAHIHLVYFFFMTKQFKGSIITCLKLLAHLHVNLTVLSYFFASTICYFLPLSHRFFVKIEKMMNVLWKKPPSEEEIEAKKFKNYNDVNLAHFEQESKYKLKREY